MLLMFLTLWSKVHFGVATNFAPEGDPWNPNPYAPCLKRDLRWSDVIVAHRTLPCNSKVLVYNVRTKRSVVATVGDRGPYGKWRKSQQFKALVDLAPATAKAVKANGWELVLMVEM